VLHHLYDYISNRINLTDEAKAQLESISNLKTYKKGDILIDQNELVDKTYFVIDGCLRSYTYDNRGKEHTLQFAVKNWWISDYIAIFNNEKSTQLVECINDAKVIEVSTDGIEKILYNFPEIEVFHRKNLERHIVSLQKRILNQLQLSSLERYIVFQEKYPDIEKYAHNYHIASYLGITQQSLSRLRAEIFKN
tara:strand:+ start:484 stop:1062 length:579 start_codon:yes stop_codon:yes gene_type:complete